jgi:hypothetical protein
LGPGPLLDFRARRRARAAVGAFTPPVLALRLRAFSGGWSRRAHAVVEHASGSLAPISYPVAVGSAIVIAAAGAQLAGPPLIPRGRSHAHQSSALLPRTGRSGSLPRAATSASSRPQRVAARAPARASGSAAGTSAVAAGSQPPVRSAAGDPGSSAGLPAAFGAFARTPDPAPILASSPSAPSLPAPQMPTAPATAGVPEAAAGAVTAVSGATREATRVAPQTIEHVVTTVVEPLAPGVGGDAESVAGHSH